MPAPLPFTAERIRFQFRATPFLRIVSAQRNIYLAQAEWLIEHRLLDSPLEQCGVLSPGPFSIARFRKRSVERLEQRTVRFRIAPPLLIECINKIGWKPACYSICGRLFDSKSLQPI